jgi:predicted nucleotidyltransferase
MGRIADRKVSAYVSALKKRFGAKVILFGSRSKGEPLDSSDYDLCVISDKFASLDIRKRLQILYEMMLKAPFNADLLAVTPEEFKRLSKLSTIYKTISKEGIVV